MVRYHLRKGQVKLKSPAILIALQLIFLFPTSAFALPDCLSRLYFFLLPDQSKINVIGRDLLDKSFIALEEFFQNRDRLGVRVVLNSAVRGDRLSRASVATGVEYEIKIVDHFASSTPNDWQIAYQEAMRLKKAIDQYRYGHGGEKWPELPANPSGFHAQLYDLVGKMLYHLGNTEPPMGSNYLKDLVGSPSDRISRFQASVFIDGEVAILEAILKRGVNQVVLSNLKNNLKKTLKEMDLALNKQGPWPVHFLR